MSGRSSAKAFVRLIEPAVADLEALLRVDPQIVRQVLKKMLLLERDPEAGEPLLGELIGWRKLVVRDRHWRIVWRVTTDESAGVFIDIAEVWAAGARADADVYVEMTARVARLPPSPATRALVDVVGLLGKAAGGVTARKEPTPEPVPSWLAERLRRQVGLTAERIALMTGEEAMELWEIHITRPPGAS